MAPWIGETTGDENQPTSGVHMTGRTFLRIATGVLLSFLSPGLTAAVTWYVDGSVSESADGKSWETALQKIQDGIDAAGDGDTVIVAQAMYVENIQFEGKNIVLMSTDPLDPSVVANTIIDGNKSGSVVTFSGTEDETCTLSGFTIRNGRAVAGAGIRGRTSPPGTRAAIENNVITDNVAENGGGGLAGCHGTIRNNLITANSCGIYGGGGLSFCDGNIVDNTISFNSASWGGGLSQCDGTVENNLIVANKAERYGGGLYECGGIVQKNAVLENHADWHGGGLSSCRAAIQNNIIAGNTADGRGGGISWCGPVINNTIVGNSADLGGGLASCSGTIKNCIVWGNNDSYGYQLVWCAPPKYSCIEAWSEDGEGNIAQDPLFIDADGPDNNPNTFEDNDYHLSFSSPCIDAATAENAPDHDIDDEGRPQGAPVDIGADEYADTDGDELPDYWERKYFGDLTHDAATDSDSDGLTNAGELALSTDPAKSDTDGDGFSDGDETVSGTDPNDPSSMPPQADVYVNGALGDDANDGARPLTAKKTIQAGIDAAQDGDTVVVMEGIYLENIEFNGKNIILRSMNPSDPACVAKTIIDGNQAGSVVTFAGTENETCVLAGLTIRNGDADLGGGICGGRDSNYTHATVHNNVITANSAMMGGGVSGCAGEIRENTISANNAAFDGGGVSHCGGLIENNVISGNSGGNGGGLYSCSGVIRNNSITRNWAYNGGGLASCSGLVEGNTISDNHASSWGGGLAFCRGTMRDNIIKGNSAWTYGGGLSFCTGSIQSNIIVDNHVYYYQSGGGGLATCSGVENNLIAGNSAPSGGGLYWCSGSIQNNTIVGNAAFSGSGGGICDLEARSTIRNCIIWGNTAADGTQLYDTKEPTYSCIQGWTGAGEGNIAADPRFLDPDGPDNDPATYEDNDYHLAADSPCVDSGANYHWFDWPQQDLDGNCRLVGSTVDMGCYEYGASPDADGDLLSDRDELALGANPQLEDTDRDGLRDGLEVLRGSDPVVATPPGTVHVPSEIATIQAALCVCRSGDEVVAAPGTYQENLLLYGPDVILRSTDPENPDTVASTVLDGRGLAPVVSFSGNESEACVLAGFTIRNGKGGIYGRSTHATIRNNVITSNTAAGSSLLWSAGGGGITGCSGPIRHNTIVGNSAEYGGGLGSCGGIIENNLITKNSVAGDGGGLCNCGGTIQNNIISENSANGSGGGLSLCNATIQFNIIAANSAGNDGGGLYNCGGNVVVVPTIPWDREEPRAIIRSNLIVGNSAKRGGGVADSLVTIESSTIVGNMAEIGGGLSGCWSIRNCIVWGNTAGEAPQLDELLGPIYSCIQDWDGGGEGNIAPPTAGFVDADGADDNPSTFEDNDYRLAPDSPCIDAGKNQDWMAGALDLDANPRIWRGEVSLTVDMGAFEFGSFPFRAVAIAGLADGGTELRWNSRPADTYIVCSCADLLSGAWNAEATVPSQGTLTSWTDTAALGFVKFYRVEMR